ncbi:hypothetical protein BROOK1789C_1108 [Bathymodiolus brooksi thiotrophic gill symbiont]|nr:hypothetical protein BROOK1789C_1108 [Bathymodiolus brooksi thiotrophic gill symbiont]
MKFNKIIKVTDIFQGQCINLSLAGVYAFLMGRRPRPSRIITIK